MPQSHGKSDPSAFWMRYYRTNDPKKTDPKQLRETIRLLYESGKTRDVHAALLGYLWNHSKSAEWWMYVELAVATQLDHGSAADVKTAFNYAADLAERDHNPNDLVRVADAMILHGYLDRVGALLDEAAAKVPHRAEPLVMSINVAQKTRDPGRMAGSIDRLLSLGWPGQDDYFRTEGRNQAEILARSLREEGRRQEADRLLAAVTQSETRDLFIRLTWDGDADFDLSVEEPLGVSTASYHAPRTVCGGAIIKNGYGSHAEEVYVCPRGFDGDYKVRVSTIYTNPSKPVTRLSVESISHEGTTHEQKQVWPIVPEKLDQPIVVHLNGGRRKQALPYFDPIATAIAETQAQAQQRLKIGKKARNPSGSPPAGAALKSQTSAKDAAKPR